MINIERSTDKKVYFTVNGRNGKVLLTSETYSSKQALKKGIDSLVKAFKKKLVIIDNSKLK